jgi:hypothetical protein
VTNQAFGYYLTPALGSFTHLLPEPAMLHQILSLGNPEGIPKSQIENILEGLGMKNVGIFMAIWYITIIWYIL